MPKIKVAVVGATGYTGSELMRILLHHPQAEVVFISSESKAGRPFSEIHPFFHGMVEQQLQSVDDIKSEEIDLAFLALPHGVSMDYVKKLANESFPIVDLSGDFRLSSPEVYEAWYNKTHTYPQGFEDAVYGLPELNKEKIKEAGLIANPGCYPTTSILGLAPLIREDKVLPAPLVVDAKSGTTGAGIKAKPANHYSTVNDNFRAYGLKHHRHSIEIQSTLEGISQENLSIQFTPHLLPVDRGILATIYARPRSETSEAELRELYQEFYKDDQFVRIRNEAPAIKDVRGSNYCDIFPMYDERTGNIMVISVIDNLVKGAAGQAVHNMNLMMNLEEGAGLNFVPLSP